MEIRAGDVLVSTVRPNLNTVATVPDELDGHIASTGFCVLRPDEPTILSRFLFYYCCTGAFVNALVTKVRGAQYPAVSDSDIKTVHIPLPLLSEQRRIVEILDQADRLRHLRIEADGKAERILPVVLTKTLGAPSTWASDRRARALGDLADFVSGGTPSKRQGLYWNGEIPWVSPKDMKQDFIWNAQDHISLNALEETNLTLIENGSVLIVVRGMILARTVPISLTRCRVTINQDLKALLPKSTEVTGQYLWAALTLAKSHLLEKVSTAGHGTKKLDTPDLFQFRIPVPSAEQLAVVEAIVRTHEALREGRRRSRQRIDQVFETLLSRAFTGDLTAEWRESHKSQLVRELEQESTTFREAT